MEWSRAEQAYLGALFGVLAMIVWAGGMDLMFYVNGQQTISAWLRLHPSYFLWPMAISLLFVSVLTWHLFLSPNWGNQDKMNAPHPEPGAVGAAEPDLPKKGQ